MPHVNLISLFNYFSEIRGAPRPASPGHNCHDPSDRPSGRTQKVRLHLTPRNFKHGIGWVHVSGWVQVSGEFIHFSGEFRSRVSSCHIWGELISRVSSWHVSAEFMSCLGGFMSYLEVSSCLGRGHVMSRVSEEFISRGVYFSNEFMSQAGSGLRWVHSSGEFMYPISIEIPMFKHCSLNVNHVPTMSNLITWYSNDMTFHSIPFHYIPWHSMTFHDILWHSIPYDSMTFNSITWHDMTQHDTTWHDIQMTFKWHSNDIIFNCFRSRCNFFLSDVFNIHFHSNSSHSTSNSSIRAALNYFSSEQCTVYL